MSSGGMIPDTKRNICKKDGIVDNPVDRQKRIDQESRDSVITGMQQSTASTLDGHRIMETQFFKGMKCLQSQTICRIFRLR
ncbi:hypothetical protein O3M35_013170 [Rhynocoris fuscipes]|uniref:Uncharacterized protein n=1 Tax=Rhynocoris fuscipes TaxID=488301 RepID=A0AAW1CJX6_9HEMI